MSCFRSPARTPTGPRRPIRLQLIAAAALSALICSGAAAAQAPPDDAMVIPRMEAPASFDGSVTDPVWKQALLLPVVQQRPVFGSDPTERTEILVGYTEDHLYVACRCYDRSPPSATSFRRNYRGGDSDFFALILDTFNDNENALGFLMTPTGSRTDGAVANDAATAADFDWDAAWEAEARTTGEGWFAEMRIPLSSLRFEVTEEGVVMGLTAWRWRARNQEAMIFPAIPQNWGAWSAWKPSQARKVLFEDLQARPLLTLSPYLLGGGSRQASLNDAGTAYSTETRPTYDVGLDVKYGLTDNFTLDLTLNTDFAQVEADDQEVNLTRFPLFFPEKRRFFLERSSTFAFEFTGSDRLFYSRRIGLHDGQPVRILGGARVVGRSGPWDVGVLNMQTAGIGEMGVDAAALPPENFGVMRARRQVLNSGSYVGGIVTSRLGSGDPYHIGFGADGTLRLAPDQYLTARWAQTVDDRSPGAGPSLDPSRLLVQWEGRSYGGLGFDLRYDRSGPSYRPEMGFELRRDYVRLGDRISYGWLSGADSPLERHRVSLVGSAYYRNADGSVETAKIGPEWELFPKGGGSLTVGLRHWIEDLRTPFPLSEEVAVPEGRHTFQTGEVRIGMPGSRRLRANLTLRGGSFYDGRMGSFQVTPTWNASTHLRLSGMYELGRVDFPHRDEAVTAHVGRIRVEAAPDVRYSLLGFLQYNSAGDMVVANFRLRYNPREGNDLYLVLNEQLNTGRPGIDPRTPLSAARTVMLKYTHTFGR